VQSKDRYNDLAADGWDYGPAFDPARHRQPDGLPLDPVDLAIRRGWYARAPWGWFFRPERAGLPDIRQYRADDLRLMRQTVGLSQHEVAGRAGIDRSTVSRIESGQIDIREPARSRLANVLDGMQRELLAYLDSLNLPEPYDPAVVEERELQNAAFPLIYSGPPGPQRGKWVQDRLWELAVEELAQDSKPHPLGTPKERAFLVLKMHIRPEGREPSWRFFLECVRRHQQDGELSHETQHEIAAQVGLAVRPISLSE
jgi:transcriptional regulator with XRE-family HTH domain